MAKQKKTKGPSKGREKRQKKACKARGKQNSRSGFVILSSYGGNAISIVPKKRLKLYDMRLWRRVGTRGLTALGNAQDTITFWLGDKRRK